MRKAVMSSPATPLRRPTALVVSLVVAAACLVALVPLPATGEMHAAFSRRWSGYAIPATGRAAGGWIGGYRVDGTPVFLTTPTKKPNRAGYGSPGTVADVAGRGASEAETARAAWILSKYGGYRDATQAAAVDASVYHLLAGGAWRITKARGAGRIRQSGNGPAVARFARIMLRQSRASAGPYSAELVATTADVGGTVAITLSVTDGHGRPASGLPVTLTMAGVASPPTVTGDDGRAVARFAADARGWQDVSATVTQVPDHLLHAWPAERDAQASAAEGGVRRTLVVTGRTAVRGPQTLGLVADPSLLVAGSPARVVATVSGDGVGRTATATLYGPFSSAAAAHCGAASVGQVSAAVAADGVYGLPALTPAGGGYFQWRVDVAGTDTSLPVTACGASLKVRSRTALTLTAPATASRFDVVAAQVTLGGLPFGGPVDVTTSLYGPYSNATDACSGTHRDVVQRRPGNGTFTSQSFQVDEPGWYAWRASVPEGDLWLGSTSTCASVGTLTQVN
jgi:hypothetical protein